MVVMSQFVEASYQNASWPNRVNVGQILYETTSPALKTVSTASTTCTRIAVLVLVRSLAQSVPFTQSYVLKVNM